MFRRSTAGNVCFELYHNYDSFLPFPSTVPVSPFVTLHDQASVTNGAQTLKCEEQMFRRSTAGNVCFELCIVFLPFPSTAPVSPFVTLHDQASVTNGVQTLKCGEQMFRRSTAGNVCFELCIVFLPFPSTAPVSPFVPLHDQASVTNGVQTLKCGE